ncbi:hypothetical protein RJ641_012053 [Dillenia turbinata]|uniref:Uncharacterized protein n=1 Tax=Dillenia turbinata TaxID=194707 RepID=A0AAN8V0Q4_9MAGN
MGDLQSLAIPSPDWNLHNFGVFNADMSLAMSGAAQFLLSVESDSSTGYLEDALGEFTNTHSKRRRISVCFHDQLMQSFDLSKAYWNFGMGNFEEISVEAANESPSRISREEEETINILTHTKSGEEAHSALERLDSSSCSSCKDSASTKSFILDKDITPSHHGHRGVGRKLRRFIGVVYPFDMVKPGGVGDMTINDINDRILTPPTRPVRHPVGDYACRPCISPDGPGLSGKAVVAFTKIRTHGRGSITIIRTKG